METDDIHQYFVKLEEFLTQIQTVCSNDRVTLKIIFLPLHRSERSRPTARRREKDHAEI